MNVKKALPLAAALVLGLISARLVMKMIQNKSSEPAQTGPRMVEVVVASRELAAGDQIQDADLKVNDVPAQTAPDKTFSDMTQVIGRVTQTSIGSGQVIVDSLLAPSGSGVGLQAVIPSGMRAITVEINEITGLAGNLVPGCHVDLLTSLVQDASTQNLTGCLAQNVEVKSVGVHVQPGQDPQVGRSVTLLVTPRQAELIDLATSVGRTRMVLRGSKDQSLADLQPVTQAELLGFRRQHAVDVSTPTTKPAADPFAGTRPVVQVPTEWSMRVVNGGQTSTVNVLTNYPGRPSAVTGNDIEDVDHH